MVVSDTCICGHYVWQHQVLSFSPIKADNCFVLFCGCKKFERDEYHMDGVTYVPM